MCTRFIKSLTDSFKVNGYPPDKESSGSFLVGYKNRLFKVGEDFQIGDPIDTFDAAGCGESYAKGALFVMDKKIQPKEKVKRALEAASYFSGAVRPPFIIENTF